MNKTVARQRQTYVDEEDYEANCYLFSPSIQRQRTICGKSYYVRRYFRGGTDFEKTMEQIAVKNVTKKAR